MGKSVEEGTALAQLLAPSGSLRESVRLHLWPEGYLQGPQIPFPNIILSRVEWGESWRVITEPVSGTLPPTCSGTLPTTCAGPSAWMEPTHPFDHISRGGVWASLGSDGPLG